MLTRAEKDAWIAALRSGDYKQGKWYLKRIDEENNVFHCCMGVLCEIKKLPSLGYDGAYDEKGNRIGAASKFAESIDSAYNFTAMPPNYWDIDKEDLASFNDTIGMTFDQIADWIEYFVETRE